MASFQAKRPLSSRVSISLGEQNLNMDNMTLPVTSALKGKKRVAVSLGGEGLGLLGAPAAKDADMSPRRKARRSMVGWGI
jgi:hypothetical protein